MKTLQPVRFALLGAGYWGTNIMRNLAEMPETDLCTVCDPVPARLATVTRRYPGVKVTAHVEDVLTDPRIAAVAIATPVSTHYALASAALESGRHVFVEKPLTTSSREARALVALARKKNRKLMVDHVFVYSPPVQKIKRLMESKKLGEIYYFDAVRVNLGAFQKDVNVIWDLAPHDLSIMDYLLDREPASISAVTAQHIPRSGMADVAYITVRFTDQLLAHIHVNWLAPAKVRQILIGGAKSMVIYDDMSPSEKIKVYDKGVRVISPTRRRVEYRLGDMWAPNLEVSEALRNALRDFAQCIRKDRRPLCDGAAGTRVVRLLEAADRSAAQRGKEIFF